MDNYHRFVAQVEDLAAVDPTVIKNIIKDESSTVGNLLIMF